MDPLLGVENDFDYPNYCVVSLMHHLESHVLFVPSIHVGQIGQTIAAISFPGLETDYFPYNQELIYKNSNRDSRYYRSENQPPNRENYALEKYSSESKCFDHGSIWEQYIEQCHKKRPVTPQAAGCYQFECISSKGIYVRIGKEKYLCEYQGQNLTIVTAEYDSIYVGTIICPDCHIICSSLNNF
ncbi:unnamed protein product [Rotaria sp. Silwood1]|nr:unnamed protein product [Rotaria sp. Silwood1]